MKKLKIFSLASKFESTTNIFNNKIYLNNIKKKLTTKKKNKLPNNSILFLLIENLDKNKKIKLLDFGGGSGEYYMNYKLPNNLFVDVFDTKELTEMGKKYSKSKLNFISNSNKLSKKYDIVFVNSVFQYIKNLNKIIFFLLKFNPDKIIFSDFYGSDNKKFSVVQNYYNQKTIFYFHSLDNLVQKMKKKNYRLNFISAFVPYIFNKMQYYDTTNLPRKFQSNFAYNLIFLKKKNNVR